MPGSKTQKSDGRIHGLCAGLHACWFTQVQSEFRSALVHFLGDGERTRERILLLSYESSVQSLIDFLQENVLESEHIEIATFEEVFTASNELDPDEMVRRLREVREEALREGRTGLRILMDMGWMAGQRSGVNQVARLCTRIDTLLLEGNLQVLAVYDRRIFSPTRLLDILPLYPNVVLNGEVADNIYYAGMEDRRSGHRHEAVLDHVLARLSLNRNEDATTGESFDVESTLRMLNTIIDSLGDGVAVADSQGNMLLFNKAATEIFGYGRSELPLDKRVRKFGNYLPDKKTPYPIDELPITRAMRGESVDQCEIFVRNERKPEGRWISATGRPLLGPNRELQGGVVVFRDITKQKKDAEQRNLLEARMSQTQKLESLGLLAGGVAHDFNNLLMGILGNAGLALMDSNEASERTDRIKDIKKTAVRLAELTNQLLDYSGQGSFIKSPVDLSDLVADMENLLRPMVPRKIQIISELTEDPVVIKADATQIRQILMNLVTNAAEAMEERRGSIRVRTGTLEADRAFLKDAFLQEGLLPGTYAFLEVTDEGCGMSPEMLSRIFDPFFTTKVRGRGLGLASVFGLVRRHKGALRVESQENIGTMFQVLFPLYHGIPAVRHKDREASLDTSTEEREQTVLIVDDEEVVRSVTRQMLEHSGFRVMTAASGAEGIEVFRESSKQIDAVLLDLSMPDMDGREVLHELKALSPEARVILSSGYSEVGTVEQFPDDALSGFLQKPYSPEVLISKVRQILGHSS